MSILSILGSGLRYLLAVILTSFALWSCASAEQPQGYRRVFVPADRPEVWPKSDEPIVPVEREELLRLLSAASLNKDHTGGPLVQNVALHAELHGTELRGTGQLNVALEAGANEFLPWPCIQTRIEEPTWRHKTPTPALLGVWGQDQSARHGLLVESSGQLSFAFRVLANPSNSAAMRFNIETPLALSTTLTLDIPKGFVPQLPAGIVRKQADDASKGVGPLDHLRDYDRWVIMPPPGPGVQLQVIRNKKGANEATPAMRSSFSTLHRIVESGIESRCTIRLQSLHDTPGEVTLAVRNGARVVGVSHRGRPLEWKVTNNTSSRRAVSIRLDAPQQTSGTELQAQLLTPFAMGESFVLPSIRVLRSTWQEEQATIAVSKRLSLLDAAPSNGAVLARVDSTAEKGGYHPSLVFQASRPESSIVLSVAHARPRRAAEVRCNTRLDLNGAEAVLQASLTDAAFDQQGKLTIPLQPDWHVQSVEMSPQGILEDWSTTSDLKGRSIVLQRTDPLSQEKSPELDLKLTLTKRLSGSLPVALPDLTAVDLSVLAPERNELILSPTAPYQLRFRNAPDHVAKQLRDQADESVRFALDVPPQVSRLADVRVMLAREADDRMVENRVQVARTAQGWRYKATIAFPESVGPSGERRVHFWPPLPAQAMVAFDDSQPFPAKRLQDAEPSDRAGQESIHSLPIPKTVQRVVAFHFSATGKKPFAIPLPAVGGAAQQRGLLQLKGVRGGAAGGTIRGLTPLVQSTEHAASALQYRYDPTQIDAHRQRIVLSPQPAGSLPHLAALASVQTRLQASGTIIHRIQYRGLAPNEPLRLILPDDARVVAVRNQNDLPVSHSLKTGAAGHVVIQPQLGDDRVSLLIEMADRDWRRLSSVRPLVPQGGTVAAWRWSVLAPQQFGFEGELRNPEGRALGWQGRLFGPLAARHSTPFNPLSQSSWKALTEWLKVALQTSPPKDITNGPEFQAQAGWTVHESLLVGRHGAEVRIVDHLQESRLLAAMTVTVALLASWLWPRATWHTTLLAVLSALAALTLPAPLAPWATSCWLGLLAGALLRGPVGLLIAKLNRVAVAATPTAAACAAPLALLLATGTSAYAAATPSELPAKLNAVLIPTDEQGQPVGDKWYVSESFLERLTRAGQSASKNTPSGWALQSCVLDGTLRQEGTGHGLAPELWTMQLELWTSLRNTTITLPLRRTDADWAKKVNVDGIAIPCQWNEQGLACSVTISEPGYHRAVVRFTPRARADGDDTCVRLMLPKCARATLLLQTPESASDIHFPGIQADRITREKAGRQSIDCSGIEDFRLCWANRAKSEATGAPGCDLLQWVSVTPKGVYIEAIYRVDANQPSEEALLVELPLGVLPMKAEGETHLLKLLPDEAWSPDLKQLTYSTKLRLDRRSGLGGISIPPLAPSNATPRSRTMAVSAGDAIAITTPTQGVGPLDPLEFLTRWGAEGDRLAPVRAAVAADVSSPWLLQSDPIGDSPKVLDQKLRLAFGRSAVTATLQASLATGPRPWHWIALDAPKGFQPLSAELAAGESTVTLHVKQPVAGRLLLFLPDVLKGNSESTLTVSGHIGRTTEQEEPLPVLSLAGQTTKPLRIDIFRHDGALVQLRNLPPAPEATAAAGVAGSQFGEVFVATIRTTTDQASTHVKTARNARNFETQSVSYHQPGPGGLQQGCSANIKVTSGIVSHVAVRSQYPADRLKLVAPEGASLVRRIAEGPERLRVTFAQPLKEGEQISLEFALQSAATPRSTPGVLLGFPDAKRQVSFVALDNALRAEAGRGLLAVRPSAIGERFVSSKWSVFRAPLPDVAPIRWFLEDKGGQSSVLALAQSQASVDSIGDVATRTRFLLLPHGSDTCVVRIPASQRLISLEVNGESPLLTMDSAVDWRVSLLSNSHPQLLTMVTTLTDPLSPGQAFNLPQLLGSDLKALRPQESVVSVRNSAEIGLTPPVESLTIGQLALDGLYLRSLTAATPEDAQVVNRAWWVSRLRDALRKVQGTEYSWKGETDPQLRGVSAPAAIAFVESLAEEDLPHLPDNSGRLLEELLEQGDWWHARTNSADGTVALYAQSRVSSDLLPRMGLSVLLAATLLGLWIAREDADPRVLLKEHRNAAIATVGLCWWLWLPAGPLGLLAVALATISELRERHGRAALAG